jgi:hypothetical protein
MDTNPTPAEDKGRQELSYLFLAIGCILLVIAYLIGISDNLPGIASMFLGGFLVILGMFYRFGKSGNRKPGQELLYWSPRVLCIAFALFTSIFALDVFGEGRGFWETAGALFMHLIPTFLILIILAVSWRREWIGGVFYIGLAAVYIIAFRDRPLHWSALVLIAAPLVLMGALFLLNWYYRDTLRGSLASRR